MSFLNEEKWVKYENLIANKILFVIAYWLSILDLDISC